MTTRILAPRFNKCEIYFCGKKKGPCRALNWFWLICHMSHKNINYTILYYSNLQLLMLTYISMEKTTNLMVKHIARSHFLGSCRQEVLLRQTAISPRQSHASETRVSKLNSTETNPVIFHIPENIFIGHATLFKHVNLFFIQTCKLIFKWKISKNWWNRSPISLCNS